MKLYPFLLMVAFILFFTNENNAGNYYPRNKKFIYSGRIDPVNNDSVALISSASAVTFCFEGDSCSVFLKGGGQGEGYNFISLEVDGNYSGKIRIDGSKFCYEIPVKGTGRHTVSIYKATESMIGNVFFCGAKVEKLLDPPAFPSRRIEFIGNSITCGVGIDWRDYPCGSGEYQDQHNAYWAYGPRVARALNLQFMLSSVSGIGIYRTWNMDGPSMPRVYENRYLDTDDSKKWDFSRFTPEVVCICLGTNDFSEGDSIHSREPFDAGQFIESYIAFVKTIYRHYPDVQIILLNSPMFDRAKDEILVKCLGRVIGYFNSLSRAKPIELFKFHDIPIHGCNGHPGKEDHEVMAKQLIPYLRPFFQ